MKLIQSDILQFRGLLQAHYTKHYREMPWREDTNPYYVMVSEIMLQQTQVARVIPKFNAFIDVFPDFHSLATASLVEVLALWSGLGYNRRAKFLKGAAELISSHYGGQLPTEHEELVKLPGIGAATASAILVYSFNRPLIFIETNIRQVIIYHYLMDTEVVDDIEIELIMKQLVDRDNARGFYWAMMDYGTYLKKEVGNLNKRSNKYTKQSKFQGSLRQKRGQIIRELLSSEKSKEELIDLTKGEYKVIEKILSNLVAEELISYNGNFYRIRE